MQLKYGKDTIEYSSPSFPLKRFKAPLQKRTVVSSEDIAQCFDHPVSASPIHQTARSGDRVLIVVSDATRATGIFEYISLLIDRLLGSGVREEDISFLFATGVHRKVTEEERKLLLGKKIASVFSMMDHHPSNDSELRSLGKTRRGTEVQVSEKLFQFSHLILTGAVQFHYHAGFTGGRKSLIPGLASHRTASHNHLLSINEKGDRDPRSAAGRLAGNPVHEDIMEGALRLPPPFIINSVLNDRGQIEAIYAGDMIKAHEKAVEYVSRTRIIRVQDTARLVIAGGGGFPKDINFIQAHKSLENCSHLVKGGGVLILVAECLDGLGSADFQKWFAMGREEMLSKLPSGSMAYGQTALSLQNTLKRIHIIIVSKLNRREIAHMGMVPAATLDEALQKSEELIGPQKEAYFIEDGTKFLFQIG
jgi:nickel-dependent lactate racemase